MKKITEKRTRFLPMTDIEKIHLERARKLNPNLDLLITRFDLDLDGMTPAEKRSYEVTNRVNQWMHEIAHSPAALEVLEEPTIFTSPEKRKEWLLKTKFTL